MTFVIAAWGHQALVLRPPGAAQCPYAVAVVAFAVLLLPLIWFGQNWQLMSWFGGAAVVLALNGRWRLLGVLAGPLIALGYTVTGHAASVGLFSALDFRAWYGIYAPSLLLLALLESRVRDAVDRRLVARSRLRVRSAALW